MSDLTYETVSRFAQQGGTVYFVAMFVAGLAYALWPRHGQDFKRLAAQPLEDDGDEHVRR